ncbi:hypothetical protein P154DRAFT_596790 [Amniculicola lignicola CBS 123094]|uniref:Uncharacterized protein n=1 Tax=Amniculicola lignicola CBS 123094 TaxID=1392246 RepID=A0A6A5WIB5_9PLEO|nr:hypothetical protein P154DRAFT_596790 [Amniculicola lignicola CBS 123094]
MQYASLGQHLGQHNQETEERSRTLVCKNPGPALIETCRPVAPTLELIEAGSTTAHERLWDDLSAKNMELLPFFHSARRRQVLKRNSKAQQETKRSDCLKNRSGGTRRGGEGRIRLQLAERELCIGALSPQAAMARARETSGRQNLRAATTPIRYLTLGAYCSPPRGSCSVTAAVIGQRTKTLHPLACKRACRLHQNGNPLRVVTTRGGPQAAVPGALACSAAQRGWRSLGHPALVFFIGSLPLPSTQVFLPSFFALRASWLSCRLRSLSRPGLAPYDPTLDAHSHSLTDPFSSTPLLYSTTRCKPADKERQKTKDKQGRQTRDPRTAFTTSDINGSRAAVQTAR